MKWFVFVVLLTSNGELGKKLNTANPFEDLNTCRNFITSYTPVILEDLEISGLLDDETLLGIGCIEQYSMHEELIIY